MVTSLQSRILAMCSYLPPVAKHPMTMWSPFAVFSAGFPSGAGKLTKCCCVTEISFWQAALWEWKGCLLGKNLSYWRKSQPFLLSFQRVRRTAEMEVDLRMSDLSFCNSSKELSLQRERKLFWRAAEMEVRAKRFEAYFFSPSKVFPFMHWGEPNSSGRVEKWRSVPEDPSSILTSWHSSLLAGDTNSSRLQKQRSNLQNPSFVSTICYGGSLLLTEGRGNPPVGFRNETWILNMHT